MLLLLLLLCKKYFRNYRFLGMLPKCIAYLLRWNLVFTRFVECVVEVTTTFIAWGLFLSAMCLWLRPPVDAATRQSLIRSPRNSSRRH